MEPTAKDIATILDTEPSLGLTLGTDLYYSRTPHSPDDCVTIVDTPGSEPMLTLQKNTSNYFYPGISIQVRATEYEDAYASLLAISEYLHAQSNITIASTYYALIKALNEPQVLHYDENDRVIMFVNFDVQRRRI